MTRRVRGPHAPHVSTATAPTPGLVGLDEAGSTPILREYRAVKAEYPDAIVMARLGDFYEFFGPDAETAAPILGVTLTGRGFGSAGRLPMCGVPHHAVTGYLRRLLDAGHRVALWDQVSTPDAAGRGLVRREVTRILTPGMVSESEFLEPGEVKRCVALNPGPGRVGLAAFDASTGELQLAEIAGGVDSAALADECERLGAAELLVPEECAVPAHLAPAAVRATLPGVRFDPGRGAERLRRLTEVASLRGLGVDDLPLAHGAAGAVLAWAERSRVLLGDGYLRVAATNTGAVMRLDAPTRRNLELVAPLGDSGVSMLGLLDGTQTPMGSRLLRRRIQEPLVDPIEIIQRLDAVEALRKARMTRAQLVTALAEVRDLERLAGRCVQGVGTPRDLAAIAAACTALPRCTDALGPLGTASTELAAAAAGCVPPPGLGERISAMLVDEPPANGRDGGAIRAGADDEFDTLVAAGADARTFIAGLEDAERRRSGIRSLKVGYNRVFGYYLEVPNAHRENVPADYVRKQTLVGAERYITPDLKEQESIVLHARERSVTREVELLDSLVRDVAAHAGSLTAAAGCIAVLDVAAALAEVADAQAWVRPIVDSSLVLRIEGGRHPLVERMLPPGTFVPNDCDLACTGGSLVVLTGPNMAGKSTFLRQTALITLLAQIGSFVPAQSAHIGVCDRIFTRVGAHDDLAAGLSTFMVEMSETALILNAATHRSLVILDEIGRGTSTYDGLSIAQAVVEYIHDAPHLGCRTLFATHYHELTALASRLQHVRNARVEVVEEGETVTFLHRIVDGGADRSYGIHVAKLAGVPGGVLTRARLLLADMEAARPLGPAPADPGQLTLGLPAAPVLHPVMEQIAGLDLDGLTPLGALNKLAEWRAQLAGADR